MKHGFLRIDRELNERSDFLIRVIREIRGFLPEICAGRKEIQRLNYG